MSRNKTKIVYLIVTILFILSISTVSATDNHILYLTKDEIKDEILRSAIDTIYIIREDDYHLFINGEKIGESSIISNKLSYEFTVGLLKIELKLDLSNNQATFKYRELSNKSIDGWLYLKTIEGVDTIYVYPDIADTKTVYILEGINNGDTVRFDDLTYNYKTVKVNLSIYIDNKSNKLVIDDGNNTKYIDINRKAENQYVFLETLVNQHTLDSKYLCLLEKNSFLNAKNIVYSHDSISNVVYNEKITLKNTKSGLTYETGISQFIGYWKRIGTEDYDTDYDETIQVVCQYGEDACAAINNNKKTYTVFGENYYVEKPYTYTVEIMEKDYSNLLWSQWFTKNEFDKLKTEMVQQQSKQLYTYAYMSDWSDYAYSQNEVTNTLTTRSSPQYRYKSATYTAYTGYIYDESIKQQCDGYNKKYIQKTFYAKSTASWSDYSAYKYSSNNLCINSGSCRSLSKRFYAYQTGIWSSYSSYIYTITSPQLNECMNNDDCAYDSATRYALVDATYTGKYGSWQQKCTDSGDYQCQTYYKYTCRNGLSFNTAYSTTKYSTGSRGSCSSGYAISKVNEGYRKAYIEFVQPTTYNLSVCRSYSDYSKCFSTKMYALKYRTWSNYTDYAYESCTSNLSSTGQSKRCKSTIKYAFSYKEFSGFSDYSYDSCNEDDMTECKAITKYATSDLKWSNYSSWQDSKVDSDKYTLVETRYKYQTRKIVSTHTGPVVPLDTVELSKDWYYRYSYPKESLVKKELVSYSNTQIGLIQNVDEDYIRDLATSIAVDSEIVKTIKNSGGTISKSEYENLIKENSAFDIKEYRRFINEEIYIPDVYITRHYRATKRSITVNAKNASHKLYTISNNVEDKYSLEQFEVYSPEEDNLRVVYFDKDQPLTKYDNLPLNWYGCDELLDKIQSVNDGNGEIIIHLTNDDITNIKKYINEKGSNGLLKEFKHIFRRVNKSLEEYLKE